MATKFGLSDVYATYNMLMHWNQKMSLNQLKKEDEKLGNWQQNQVQPNTCCIKTFVRQVSAEVAANMHQTSVQVKEYVRHFACEYIQEWELSIHMCTSNL